MDFSASIHESLLVLTFVIPDKKERYSTLLHSVKKRQDILNRFNHFFDFNPALSFQIKRTSGLDMAKFLQSRGAGPKGYIIGGSDDSKNLPLEEAVERCLASPSGAVISCIPGHLALFLQEFPPGNTYLLIAK